MSLGCADGGKADEAELLKEAEQLLDPARFVVAQPIAGEGEADRAAGGGTGTLSADRLRALPRLKELHFVRLGAFRVPTGIYGTSHFGYSGTALAFNPHEPSDPSDDTLFISGHVHNAGSVAEINIPRLKLTDELYELPVAQVIQPFADITEGKLAQVKHANSVALGGLLVDGDRLIWSGYDVYDAAVQSDRSHGFSALNLSQKGSSRGMFRVGLQNPGMVAGYMTLVPRAWRSELAADVLTGQSNLNIITRTSAGPAAMGFHGGELGRESKVEAIPYLYYPVQSPLGGNMGSKNALFNYNSTVGGMVFPEGSRSIVFFGGHATGEWRYGTPEDCEDPVRGGKGHHDVGGHYVYQAWAYDVLELLTARREKASPWTVQPYSVWTPRFPFPRRDARIGGVAYDGNTNRVFVVQYNADPPKGNDLEPRPIIHVYHVELPGKE